MINVRTVEVNMRNVRGITPIISVILLLMMSVAVAGLAWFWLQSLAGTTMNATEGMTKQQTNQMLTLIDIADYSVGCIPATGDANNITLQVFNRGSTNIDVNGVVINGRKFDVSPSIPITTGSIGSIVVSSATAYVPGLSNTTSKGADIMLSSVQGYVKKTMTLEGARCNP